MIPMVVDEIRRLSQGEGLADVEIAERLGLSRVTICRVRRAFDIPRANRDNRRDKSYACSNDGCEKIVTIARHERKQRYCPECKAAIELERRQRRREQQRARKQAKQLAD